MIEEKQRGFEEEFTDENRIIHFAVILSDSKRYRSVPLVPEKETDRNLFESECFSDPVDQVAFVGEVDRARVPDEQDEGGRLDRDLRDVVEDVRSVLAAGRRILPNNFADLSVEFARLDAHCILGIDPFNQIKDLCDPLT